MHTTHTGPYDLVIIGGGVSGAAQLYAAARYTNLKRVLLLEKEPTAGAMNSDATQNSQTLHEGDIETNYNLAKATAVKHKADFTRRYLERFKSDQAGELYMVGPKMLFAAGEAGCKTLRDRFDDFRTLFPELTKYGREELEQYEPALVKGRPATQPVLALYNPNGMTVNYGRLAAELLRDAEAAYRTDPNRTGEVRCNTAFSGAQKTDTGYLVQVGEEQIATNYLSICAGAHSMYFAKQLGIDAVKSKSLLLVAGNFYYTPKLLKAKVYTLQNPKLPFSAVHGDPDILNPDTKTRYGPTTRIVFTLERRRLGTLVEYVTTLTPFLKSLGAYLRILLDRDFFWYAFKHNVLFVLPGVGTYFFMREVQTLIPTVRYADVSRAKGQGGVRPQIVDTTAQSPLNMGDAKLTDTRLLVNVTPSPGATTAFYNGLADIEQITKELGADFVEEAVETDFGLQLAPSSVD